MSTLVACLQTLMLTVLLQIFQHSHFSRESLVFWCIVPVSQFLSKSPDFWNSSKINCWSYRNTRWLQWWCGNRLKNLSFVPKPNSFFDCSWRSVSFHNSFPRSSFRGPSSHPVVLQKRLLWQYIGVMSQWKHPCFQTPKVGMSSFTNSRFNF